MTEINFDGLIGPSHNYAGLSRGNIASTSHGGSVSRPCIAALQGIDKMRRLMALGVPQGFFPPPRRPATAALRRLGFAGNDRDVLLRAVEAEPALLHACCSASSMWTANAATVLAAADTTDRRVHFIPANLGGMLHRTIEADDTAILLSRIFCDRRHFMVHPPLPFARHFGDEGAANHMRMCGSANRPGINVFVHGEEKRGGFPQRQAKRASEAVARLAGLDPALCRLQRQTDAAIESGAFHNDVVAVSNGPVLLAHSEAFAGKDDLFEFIVGSLREAQIIEVFEISLVEAVASYLFNSQLVTLPGGNMALVVPRECQNHERVWSVIERILATDNPIEEVVVVDVHESMRNGGGPACLRLRVPVGEHALMAIDGRFLLTDKRCDRLERLVEAHWPRAVEADDVCNPDFWDEVSTAQTALETLLDSDF